MKELAAKLATYRGISTLFVFVVIVMVFAFLTPNRLFVDPRNLIMLARHMPELGVVALGIGMLMICGEFDLSIGSILPLSSYIFTCQLVGGMNPILALLVALAAGAAMGLVNGLIVTRTGISSFITTLGAMMFWRGVLYLWARGATIAIHAYVLTGSALDRALIGTIGFVPVQIIWFVLFAVIFGLLLHRHKFGNWIYSTGDNKEAARAMGINTDMVKILCFVIVGVLSAFSGVMQVVRMEVFAATQGRGFELRAIAAVVVGGTSLFGGVGTMLGVFLGAITIQILDNGLIMMRVPAIGVTAFIGSAIILFVILNTFVERRAVRV
jgi:simple sugar transport system permease protein